MGENTPWTKHMGKLALGLIVMMFIALVVYYCEPVWSRPSPETLIREIEQELPIGSDDEQIRAWYRSKGIEYTYLEGNRPDSSDKDAHYSGVWSDYGPRRRQILVKVYVDEQGHAIRIHAVPFGDILLP